MALAAATGLAQFDLIGVREDLSDIVSEILLADASLLSRIGISGVATNVTHEWLEDALNANSVTDNESGGLDAGGSNTDLVLVTGQGSRVRIGALLRDKAEGLTEVLQVTAISTDTLTVTRGFSATSPEAHASGATWQIVGQPVQSGADMSGDVSTTRTRVNNFCQIFEKGIQIAGDSQAVTKAGVADELAHQAKQRLMEVTRELDTSIIMGVKSTSAGSDSVYRSMDGLVQFLTQADANSNSTSEAISPDVLNQLYQDAFDDGGDPSILAVSQTQMRKISAFDADKVRVVQGSGMRGSFVPQFMTDLGKVLDIVVDRWIPSDTVMILDPTRITVVPLQGRAFGIEPIAKTGDAFKRQILGDYTLECRNAKEAHAIHTNLLTT